MRQRVAVFLSIGGFLVCSSLTAATIAEADNFVNQMYLDLLARPADPAAYSAFATPIANGTITPQQAATSVLNSQEYRTDLIDSYYSSYLGRTPSNGELAPWLTFLGGGGTDEGAQSQILGSLEFFNDIGATNPLYVAALYNDVLHRSGSPAEQVPFINALGLGATRVSVALAILQSQECDTDLVNLWYSRFLRRSPFGAEANPFINALQTGSTDEQVIAAIVGSQEYFALAQTTPTQAPEPGTYGVALGLCFVAAARCRRGRRT